MTPTFRSWLRIGAVALAACAIMPPLAVRAQDGPAYGESINIQTFYEALEPHGRWFAHPHYGSVWSPDVDRDWRPYTRGRWQFTDEHGWYWEAEEPWGWAVFHYGRWFLDDDSGWVWVPGTEWGPAWVAWRHNDEQVGWAPLPPEAEWRGGALSFSERYYDSPRYSGAWCFAPVAALTAYSVYRYVYPPSRNRYFVRNTTWVPSHRHHEGRFVYNAGFDRRRYEQITRQRITPLRIVTVDRPLERRGSSSRSGGRDGVIQSYRPRIVGAPGPGIQPRRLDEPPRRDWRQGRPGITQPPFPRGGEPDREPGRNRRFEPQPSVVQPRIAPNPPVQQPPARGPDGRGSRDRDQPRVIPTPGPPPPPQPSVVQPRIAPTPPVQQRRVFPTPAPTPPQQPAVIQPRVAPTPTVQQPPARSPDGRNGRDQPRQQPQGTRDGSRPDGRPKREPGQQAPTISN